MKAAADMERHALEMARLAAAGQMRLFEGARQLLSALARLPEVSSSEAGAADVALRHLVQQHPFYLNLIVAETNGTVLSSAVAFDPPANVAEYACMHEAVKQRQFATGGFRLGKISGRPSLGVAYPVLGSRHEVHNLLLASLDLQYLSRELVEVQLPQGAHVTVVDTAGRQLGAVPPSGQAAGELSLILPSTTEWLAGRSAQTMRTTGRDSVKRFYAYAPVRVGGGVDAWVMMAIPAATVYANANAELKLHLLGLVFVIALALVTAWFGIDFVILRNVRAMVSAAQKMKDGELGARTGLAAGGDELGQLASAFDAMAVALQQRDMERLRAADALRRSRDQLELLVRERAAELANERDLLRSLVDGLPDYVYVKGRDGRYIVDNASHRSLLGVEKVEEVVGRTAFDFFSAELADRYQADDRQIFETGLPLFDRQEQVADRSGKRFWIATTKVPLRDKDGKVIGLVGVGRNIASPTPQG